MGARSEATKCCEYSGDSALRFAPPRCEYPGDSLRSSLTTVLTSRNTSLLQWLETKDCNSFLKKVQKNPNIKDMLIQRIAELYGLSMVQEEEANRLETDISQREQEIEHLTHKNVYYNDKLSLEEEVRSGRGAKRRAER